jgi:hypothetical protein
MEQQYHHRWVGTTSLAAPPMVVEVEVEVLVAVGAEMKERGMPCLPAGTVRDFRQKITLEDAIERHAFALRQALPCV